MHDLVVVGAGPYGLSIAAHAAAAGLDLRILGRPMASWRDHMPPGMFLKSEPWSSSLSDPAGERTLAAYCASRGLPAEHGRPVPIAAFTDYGMDFAASLQPPVEERTVTSVAPQSGSFRVETADGEPLFARAVAVAVGVMPFVNRPYALAGLPAELASHSADHGDLSRFRGRDVTVVGAGQAALETAALLAENGARPQLLARAGSVHWNTPPQPLRRGLLTSLRDPHCGLGTGWPSWVWSETPGAVRMLPGPVRAHIAAKALGPAGAWWLRERVEGTVPFRLGTDLLRATRARGGVRLTVAPAGGGEPEKLDTGHVIAATGFVPDMNRLTLLDPVLRDSLRTVRFTGAPELGRSFESSHRGLFFAGLLAAPSFGPSMRFVYGAGYTASSLVRGVRQRLGARRRVTVPAPALPSAGGRSREEPDAPGALDGLEELNGLEEQGAAARPSRTP